MKIPDITPCGYYWVKYRKHWYVSYLWKPTAGAWFRVDVIELPRKVDACDLDELGPRIVAPDQVHDLNLSTKVMRQYKILNPDQFDAELVQWCKDAEESVDELAKTAKGIHNENQG